MYIISFYYYFHCSSLNKYKIGGAQISEKHAGFVINSDDAKAEDVIKLIEYTKEKVKEKFNVEIETEMILFLYSNSCSLLEIILISPFSSRYFVSIKISFISAP